VTICREWSLVKNEHEIRRLRPLYCRSWNCDVCAPRRRAQLMAACAAGNPNRFITLTVNPRVGESPSHRLSLLARAWRVTVQRLRRRYPTKRIDYFAIVEETQAGEPHLHILFRGPYVPQAYLSQCMAEIISSPIVDIRKIKNVRETIRYVAKYVTKAPARFGDNKRYWSSRTYEEAPRIKSQSDDGLTVKWSIDRRPLIEILTEWMREGFLSRRDTDDVIIGWLPPPGAGGAAVGLRPPETAL